MATRCPAVYSSIPATASLRSAVAAMVRIAVLGATGYAAKELLRLLLAHPAGRDHRAHHAAGRRAARRRRASARCAAGSTCGWRISTPRKSPSGPTASSAACRTRRAPRPSGRCWPPAARVVDLSADYRLNDAAVYAEVVRPRASRPGAPGRDRLRPAGAVPRANSAGAARRQPRLLSDVGDPAARAAAARRRRSRPTASSSTARAASAAPAATPKPHLHFPECNESFSAYGVGTHRHMPEIDQVLTDCGGGATDVVFTPHLVPMDRGILTTATRRRPSERRRRRACSTCSASSTPTSRSSASSTACPATKDVVGTNFCDITVRVVRGRVVVDQRDRQPDQRRRRRGGAELQPDVRLRRNDGAIVDSSCTQHRDHLADQTLASRPAWPINFPQGFRAAGVYSGVKRNAAEARPVAGRLRPAGRRRRACSRRISCSPRR